MHLVLFGFVYWQTAAYMTSRVRCPARSRSCSVFAANTPEQRLAEIDDRLRKDPRRIKVAGLFGADGSRIAGNMESLPPGLDAGSPDQTPWSFGFDSRGREMQKVRVTAHLLPSGEVLVIGRNIDEIAEIAEIVGRALALGLLPAFGLAVIIGMVLSQRAHNRALGSQPEYPAYRCR